METDSGPTDPGHERTGPAGTRDRPRWFNGAIEVLLASGAAVFVLLLSGVGSGIMTGDEPDAGSTLYASQRPSSGEVPAAQAAFAITAVAFGDDGYVEIRNVGGAAGRFQDWFLCQRPAYQSVALEIDLAPGEGVWVAVGDGTGLAPSDDIVVILPGNGGFGRLQPEDGEIGLYRDSSFGNAGSILSYVEWGEAGHGRSSVAVDAGIWQDGGFVPGGGSRITATGGVVPISPTDWSGS